MAYEFAAGVEREEQRIVDDYKHYLGRSPDGSGISYWLAQVANGMTDEDRAAAFVASREFYDEHK